MMVIVILFILMRGRTQRLFEMARVPRIYFLGGREKESREYSKRAKAKTDPPPPLESWQYVKGNSIALTESACQLEAVAKKAKCHMSKTSGNTLPPSDS